jgi:hypothetical protein
LIGVWQAHFDYSQDIAAEGIQPTPISAGKYKVEGNPYAPLDEEAQGFMQSRVDDPTPASPRRWRVGSMRWSGRCGTTPRPAPDRRQAVSPMRNGQSRFCNNRGLRLKSVWLDG